MDTTEILKHYGLTYLVKDLWILEGEELGEKKLPFYADGFAGVVFLESDHDAFLLPAGKKVPNFFIYGQTLEPVQISLKGRFTLICFQLYAFSGSALLNIETPKLNDDCYDLEQVKQIDTAAALQQIKTCPNNQERVGLIAKYLRELIDSSHCPCDRRLQIALPLILENKGQITVSALRETLNITERSLQRLFREYVGISPKQFIKIIRFRSSLNLISDAEHQKLTDLVHLGGYADQSHFIRNFKKYTGITPSEYKTA